MAVWRHLLGGLLLWTAHFFAVYGIASLFPGTRLAVILVLVVTVAALGLAGMLLARSVRNLRRDEDRLGRWNHKGSALLYALAATAILYQGLPAAFA